MVMEPVLPFAPVPRPPAISLAFAACLALLVACARQEPPSPYVRVTAESGRIYYADQRNWLHSPTGGFLAFRDLVTAEKVRLRDGSYRTDYVPFAEVDRRRTEFMYNRSKPPRVDEP
jgi:hypothetical protein